MLTIPLELPSHSYPVYLGEGILDDASIWDRHLNHGKTLIVSNDVVAPLYLEKLQTALGNRELAIHIIPDGEPFKTEQTWSAILDQLVAMQARRDATIIALGGGVVGDISGFAAASYMRGIRFIQAPTTLLAQVDASVGGKTGFNHQQGKNLIGAFHQPAAVVIDSCTLDTLQDREFNAGLAEVVKYGAIMDPELFDWLENNTHSVLQRDPACLHHLVKRSVLDKARIVSQDELEAGIRAILNFGHSFGHAIEAVTRYERFLHGEAVSIGMVVAARLSEQRGLSQPPAADRLSQLLSRFNLPVKVPAQTSTEQLSAALNLDKKAVAGSLRLILLKSLGEAVIDSQSKAAEITAAISSCR